MCVRNQAEFSAEICIPFRGPRYGRSGLSVLQPLVVCLDSGFSRFVTPKGELARLAIVRSTEDGVTFERNASGGSHTLRSTLTA